MIESLGSVGTQIFAREARSPPGIKIRDNEKKLLQNEFFLENATLSQVLGLTFDSQNSMT